MKRFGLALLVASSVVLSTMAGAAARPHYGGTVRVAIAAAPGSLDPVDLDQANSLADRNVSALIFETLVTLDDRGRPQPALAVSWRAESGNQRWQFNLRPGVTFHDGTPLTSDRVAASLRVANPSWKAIAAGDSIVIERDSPAPNLPAELALTRNGVAKRDGGKLLGTGPYVVKSWVPGKALSLAAFNDHSLGRPFADAIEITMAENYHDQMLALDLGKADLIEVAAEQARRAAAEGKRVETSAPVELMALVFAHDAQSPEEDRRRQALAVSIDRAALNSVLLQAGGEPAGGLLPNWMTGYGFIFPIKADVSQARQMVGESRQSAPWTIAYDAADPVARVVTDRIVLNAHDAGVSLQLTNSAAADLRLVRVSLVSLDARSALGALAAAFSLKPPALNDNTPEEIYSAENTLLQSRRVIPLLHLRASYALSGALRNWGESPAGRWRLDDAWLGAERPDVEKP